MATSWNNAWQTVQEGWSQSNFKGWMNWRSGTQVSFHVVLQSATVGDAWWYSDHHVYMSFASDAGGSYNCDQGGQGADRPVVNTEFDVTLDVGYGAGGTTMRYSAGQDGCSASDAAWVTWDATCTTPPTPTIGTNTRNSDTSNTISWTNTASGTGYYSNLLVERKTDAGSWTQIANLGGGSTGYTDTSTTANHAYAYRVRAYNPTGYSGYSAATSTTYNTPATPTDAKATVVSGTTISVTWTNPANTATASVVERSTDGGTTWSVLSTVTGTAVTSCSDTYGGTAQYRIKNTRDSLVSAYATTNSVTSLCAPAAPTLLSPASSAVVTMGTASVPLKWQHNSIDTSTQTAAKVMVSTDAGSTWTTYAVTTAATYALDTSAMVNGTAVSWKVATKGAATDYGPYSEVRTFSVKQAPALTITAPATDGEQLTTAPVTVTFGYSDAAGALASLAFTVSDSAGQVVYSYSGTATSVTIPLASWTPDNGATYSIAASARSSSTLSTTAARTFGVDYAQPATPTAQVIVHEETGSVEVQVSAGTGTVATDYLAVSRIVDGVATVIATAIATGGSIVDRLPPLNTALTYRVYAWTGYGANAYADYSSEVVTSRALFNFGDGWSDSVSFEYNQSESGDHSDDDELYTCAGHLHPILGTGSSNTDTYSASATIYGRAAVADFSRIAAHRREPFFYRSTFGVVAKVHLTWTDTAADGGAWGRTFDITMTEVE